MNPKFLLSLLVLVLLTPVLSRAEDQAATNETRLREALRNTMLQLREAQNQAVTLQAAQAQSDKDNADLKAKTETLGGQLAALTKQSADDKATSDKSVAELKAQGADLTGQVARLNEALEQWKKAYNQVAQLAAAKEAERAKLAIQAAQLQRVVDDREEKNRALFKTGNEILTRYEKFGLGDAIGAKEPFVGLTRTKLEELVQGYKDKLLDQKFISGEPVTPPPAPAAEKPPGQASAAASSRPVAEAKSVTGN